MTDITASEADIRAAITRYAAAWAAGDRAAMPGCYHDGFSLHYAGRHALSGDHVGKAAALATLAEFSRRTHRRLVRIVATMAEPERGAIIARELLGEGPAAVEVERLLVYAVEDGLLKDCWVHDQDQALIDRLVNAGTLNSGTLY